MCTPDPSLKAISNRPRAEPVARNWPEQEAASAHPQELGRVERWKPSPPPHFRPVPKGRPSRRLSWHDGSAEATAVVALHLSLSLPTATLLSLSPASWGHLQQSSHREPPHSSPRQGGSLGAQIASLYSLSIPLLCHVPTPVSQTERDRQGQKRKKKRNKAKQNPFTVLLYPEAVFSPLPTFSLAGTEVTAFLSSEFQSPIKVGFYL